MNALLISLLLAAPVAAFAHGHLLSSVPTEGQTASEAPRTVTLKFSESVQIATASLQEGSSPAVRLDALPSGTAATVVLAMPALNPGRYTLTWRAVGADRHAVTGTLTFSVAPTAASSAKH